MPLLTVDNVSMTYHARELLSGINLRINEGDKIAFIGNNGTGKSTLFRIIRGVVEPQEGKVIRHGNTTIGFLSQNMEEQDFNGTTLKPLEIIRAEEEKNLLELEISSLSLEPDSSEYKSLMERYSRVATSFESMGGYDYDYRMREALAGLGLTGIDDGRDLTTLSGGEKMRVCLAQLIISRPDILMLDEPTNHLDIEAIEWLETYLSSYGGAIFVISHDRHFINNIANRIIELDSGKITEYRGNYSSYREQKEAFIKTQQATIKNLEAELEHQLDVKQTMLSHRNISGYHQREKMVDKLASILEYEKSRLGNNPLRMSFTMVPEVRSGAEDKILIKVSEVSKRFDDEIECLFSNVSFELKANQKIFLCGPNGCGKSTLLTMLLGRQGGFDGTVFVSQAASSGYMGQFVPFDDESLTCLEELMGRTDMSETSSRSLLARFGFRDLDVYKRIEVLSGGERSRLYLCCLLQEKPDILFLDEPTNHLDIESREVLEDAIRDYNGAVICVSHDRFFIEKCADSILGFSDNTAHIYDSYSEYRDRYKGIKKSSPNFVNLIASNDEFASDIYESKDSCDTSMSVEDKCSNANKSSNENRTSTSRDTQARMNSINRAQERKLEAKRKERIRAIENEIEEVEEQQAVLEANFGSGASNQDYEAYASNASRLEALYEELVELEG